MLPVKCVQDALAEVGQDNVFQAKVLIVEDNAVNAMLMAKVLQKAHYSVVVMLE